MELNDKKTELLIAVHEICKFRHEANFADIVRVTGYSWKFVSKTIDELAETGNLIVKDNNGGDKRQKCSIEVTRAGRIAAETANYEKRAKQTREKILQSIRQLEENVSDEKKLNFLQRIDKQIEEELYKNFGI